MTKAKAELKQYNLSIEELPLIKFSDPAIQSLIDKGKTIQLHDVIKITRNSRVGGEVPYFRKVVY